jgi:hypothetical protein
MLNQLLRNKLFLLIPAFLILFAVVGLILYQNQNRADLVSNFKECAEAGNPVTESHPRQCHTSQGQTYIENIGNELEKKDLITVDEPRPNSIIANPLSIRGQARGYWYFEADFPVRLEDESGNVLGRGIATAQGEWMTKNFVPFAAEISFSPQAAGQGTLILEKNNPSGIAENYDELRLPVRFEAVRTQSLQLFFYNTRKDPNRSCSADAVFPVSRNIPSTKTSIQDGIKLLLKGTITAEEQSRGFTTEFPLSGVELRGADLRDGILTLEFSDPEGRTVGGSCRVSLLRSQIEKTAKQFSQVREVRFIPEDLFQP